MKLIILKSKKLLYSHQSSITLLGLRMTYIHLCSQTTMISKGVSLPQPGYNNTDPDSYMCTNYYQCEEMTP